jgi:hypothetical protein
MSSLFSIGGDIGGGGGGVDGDVGGDNVLALLRVPLMLKCG